ncbi:MAG: sugar ABC transporter ATP-binding protein [Promicromonosporaceae bacterium]|nr:sugar ABC transporter ATP-binding protein [Promicromonosporaceae bacterium]
MTESQPDVTQGDGERTVSLRHVAKTYGETTVLSLDELELRFGEVTGLVGENGAGKSTLLGILSGMVAPDPGSEIEIAGEPLTTGSPMASKAAGVAMVSQEFPLVNQLSVAENLCLGMRPEGARRFGYDARAVAREAQRMLDGVGLDVSPAAVVSTLSVPARQMLEIAKAVGRPSRLLVLDEPTSALGPVEADKVIAIARRHAAEGGAVLFVGHRLEEVREASDRILVLRNGRKVDEMPVAEASDDRLIRSMVGRDLFHAVAEQHEGAVEKKVVFAASRLEAPGVGPVDLTVHEGEILGIAGLMGAGRSRLVHTLFGGIQATGGSMTLGGRKYAPRTPKDAVDHGVALVPEDRKLQSIVPGSPVRWNVTLPTLQRIGHGGVFGPAAEKRRARTLLDLTKVRLSAMEQPVRSLSGGNQQRVVFSRWFGVEPQLLILDEPTRGVDVGAKADIYDLIEGAAENGVAVIVVSSELDELFGLADRIAVLRKGRIEAVLDRSEFSKEVIMRSATGVEVAS